MISSPLAPDIAPSGGLYYYLWKDPERSGEEGRRIEGREEGEKREGERGEGGEHSTVSNALSCTLFYRRPGAAGNPQTRLVTP